MPLISQRCDRYRNAWTLFARLDALHNLRQQRSLHPPTSDDVVLGQIIRRYGQKNGAELPEEVDITAPIVQPLMQHFGRIVQKSCALRSRTESASGVSMLATKMGPGDVQRLLDMIVVSKVVNVKSANTPVEGTNYDWSAIEAVMQLLDDWRAQPFIFDKRLSDERVLRFVQQV